MFEIVVFCVCSHFILTLKKHPRRAHIRCIQDQSVPLALDVIILRLLSDVEAIKLQLSCKFFLPFKDHQWNLPKTGTHVVISSQLTLSHLIGFTG